MGTSKDCQVMELSSRLKREDYTDAKYDSIFGAWKVLIGPSDWEDHSMRKEGAERYRVHNLPDCSSCPGLYELGILIPQAHSGRKTGNLDHQGHDIVPVYLGQTDNVRTRLQNYGRKGAHLEIGNSSGQLNDYVIQQGHQPFSEAFSRGYSVVYRWAPMKDKAEAEEKEARLLDTYDYAWNKGKNGVRRDVFQKLDRKLTGSHQKKIDAKDGSSIYTETDWERNDFLPQIFKFGRSQPRLITPCLGFNNSLPNICGVALDHHGSVCTMPPVEQRKRCEAHKGIKVNDLASKKLLTEGKPLVTLEDRKTCEDQKGRKITGLLPSESVTDGKTGHYVYGPILEAPKSNKPQFPGVSERSVTNYDTICGVELGNGTFCTEQPVEGRKRCEDHKGMRANKSKFSSVFDSLPHSSVLQEDYSSSTCGATTAKGSSCRNPPAGGGKRCWQHQVMWADTGRTHSFTSSCYSGGTSSDVCGASTKDGSICHRTPVSGNKRCWQHAGERAAF